MFKHHLVLCVCLSLLGCDSAESRGTVESGERLVGEWSLELRIAHPPQLGTDPARLPVVRGSVALLPNQQVGRVASLGGVPTNYGSHTLDLSPLGVGQQSHGRVPTVVARLQPGDSIRIALHPGSETSEIILAGRFLGDSVTGSWHFEAGRSTGSSGTFVLRRDVAGNAAN